MKKQSRVAVIDEVEVTYLDEAQVAPMLKMPELQIDESEPSELVGAVLKYLEVDEPLAFSRRTGTAVRNPFKD